MSTLTIAGTAVRRLLRDRISLFFVVLLPVVIILVMGTTLGGIDTFRLGVLNRDTGPLATGLVDELAGTPSVRLSPYQDEAAARTALRRGELDAVVIVPAGTGAALRRGERVAVPVVETAVSGNRQAMAAAISAALGRHAARVQAAAFASAQAGGTLTGNLATAGRLQAAVPALAVRTQTVDATADQLPAGFGYSAPTMLVLFVFVNTLAGGAAMIETRRLGIHDRIMAGPVRAGSIVLGEGLCYLFLGLLQSGLIVTIGWLLFGVHWGAPLGVAALVAVWALVGAGAGMLSGTLFRTPEQASAIGPAVGIAFGMLGGCMWPLSIVAPAMRAVGHLVPQSWAVDAWTALIARGGGLADIGRQLGVLTGFAALLLGLAALRLHRRLTGAARG